MEVKGARRGILVPDVRVLTEGDLPCSLDGLLGEEVLFARRVSARRPPQSGKRSGTHQCAALLRLRSLGALGTGYLQVERSDPCYERPMCPCVDVSTVRPGSPSWPVAGTAVTS